MVKGLLLLMTLGAFFSSCSLEHKNKPGPDVASPAASLDKIHILKTIYGEATPVLENGKTESVLWKNITVPQSLDGYFSSAPQGKARLVFDAFYKENGVDKRIALAATAPAVADYSCHACGLLIGGAVFARSAEGWRVESQNAYIAVAGKWGVMEGETIRLMEAGPGRHGVLLSGSDMHQGYESCYVSLLIPYGKSIVESLHFFVEGPGEGVCEDAVGKQGIALKPSAQQKNSQGYYDLEADVRFNEGDCGKVKQVQETRRFSFIDGKYQKVK